MDVSFEHLDVQPWFDMEMFMSLSQETRMDGDTMDRCMTQWKTWTPHLQVRRLDVGKQQYLLVELAEAVDNEVDAAWDKAPAQAFFLNALAQTMCMSAVHDVLPQIEDAGCAPAPRPTDELRAALVQAGVPYQAKGPGLSRRFAVLTPYPFKGGCEVCALKADCPKGNGSGSSVLLPGYEQ